MQSRLGPSAALAGNGPGSNPAIDRSTSKTAAVELGCLPRLDL
jgi:hypothetical protein